MHMTDCFFALMGNALLACASIATEREADASSAHPRVLGLPLPLAILSNHLSHPTVLCRRRAGWSDRAIGSMVSRSNATFARLCYSLSRHEKVAHDECAGASCR
jgi:hypothetical protein